MTPDSVERIVAEMRGLASLPATSGAVTHLQVTLWADRLSALAVPQQAGGEDGFALDAALERAAIAEAEVEQLRAGIVPRDNDVIVPLHLYDEINATGAEWKQRAEAAEAKLREAERDARRWRSFRKVAALTVSHMTPERWDAREDEHIAAAEADAYNIDAALGEHDA